MDTVSREASVQREQIQLMIVGDHPVIRAGVRTLLENESDLEVVAEAESIEAAVSICGLHQPDVVLMDLGEPTPAVVQAVKRLQRACEKGALVILGRHDADEDIFRAIIAGAAGHVGDASQPDELLTTIRQAAQGGEPISHLLAERPGLGRRVLETYRQLSDQGQTTHDEEVVTLSHRELEVLRYAADGLTNRKIGRALGLSEHTIKSTFSQILARLGLANRTEAVVHAVREGWITVPITPEPDADLSAARAAALADAIGIARRSDSAARSRAQTVPSAKTRT